MLSRMLIVAWAWLGLCGPASASLASIRQAGQIVIGTDATYPPFETVSTDERFVGFDIDLGNDIARELGVKARWINSSFDGIFPALLAGKFDLVMSSVTVTPDRQRAMAISDPYYDAGQCIVVHRNHPALSPAQLAGKRVGVQIATTGQFMLEKRPGVIVRKYPDVASALLDLHNDRLDAVVNDLPTTRYMIVKTFGDLVIVSKPLTDEHYGICMRPQDRQLLAAVNRALARIKADGRYQALTRRWFGQTKPSQSGPAPAREHWRRFLSALPDLLTTGASWTLALTMLGLLFGIPLGLAVGLLRIVPSPPVNRLAAAYVEIVRGSPLLVQIFTIYYVLPSFGLRLPAFPAAILALSLNAGAYLSEIFRAGISSISKGQMEAARGIGLSWLQAMSDVIVPQALRRIVPPVSNEAIALLKDSSLVMVMGMAELTRRGQELTSATADPVAIWPAVALCYLLMTLPLTALARYLEGRWNYG